MQRRTLLALAITLLAHSPAVAAADPWQAFDVPAFDTVAVRDGLPHGTVTSIAQDSFGAIWLGTFGGLVRYDGHRMQVFRQDPLDPKQLPDSYVRAIAPLDRGRLLIGTNAGGVVRFDPRTMRFDRYPVGRNGTAHAKIFALSPDGHDRFWIATEGGLDHLDVRTGRVERVPHAPGAAPELDPRTFTVLKDRRGNLWVGTNDGLLLRKAGTQEFIRPSAPMAAHEILRDKIWALHEDRSGRLWVGSGQSGIMYFDETGSARLVESLSGVDSLARRRTVRAFLETLSGEIWAATDGGGVVTFAPDTGRTTKLTHDPTIASSLPGDITRALLQDRAGNIWVATEVGAAHYDPTARVAFSIPSSPLNALALSDPNVHCIWVDPRGRIWLGLGMGRVDILDRAAGRIHRLRLPGEQAERDVQAFIVGPDGKIWAGSQGVARIDPDSFAVSGSLIPGLDTRLVLSMMPDGDDVLIGTYDGLFRYSHRTQKLERFVHDPAKPHSLAGNQVRHITRMPHGEFWFSTITGISISKRGRPGFFNLRNDPADAQSLPQDYAGSIEFDSRRRVWLGTFGGVGLLDRAAPPYRFRRVTAAAGLASEKINALLIDGRDRAWVSTSDGVAVIDGTSLQARNLSARDGLRIDSYVHRSAARSPDGALMFGGLGGLTVVRPEFLRPPVDRPSLAITNLVVNGQTVPFASLPTSRRPLRLEASKRGLRADFALLDFREPARTRYSYRLEGFDQDWIDVPFGTPPAATYTNLPSGDYRLRIRASVDGLFPRNFETAAAIAIQPHWFETLWFRALAGLGVLAGLAASVALWTRLLRQRARRLATLVEERTQELREANERLEALAGTDPLTGIANRRRFLECAAQECERAIRFRHQLSLLIIDLDHFKAINDSFGHPVGDEVLRWAASQIAQACRSSDIVARFGGEEIVVLLPETDGPGAHAAAEHIRERLAMPTEHDGRRIAITASVGVAEWRAPQESIGALITRADRALYLAKRSGRDRAILAGDTDVDLEVVNG